MPYRKIFNLIDRAQNVGAVKFLRAEIYDDANGPLATIFYSVNGEEQPLGLRLDIGKRTFLDETGFEEIDQNSKVAGSVADVLIQETRVVADPKGYKPRASIKGGFATRTIMYIKGEADRENRSAQYVPMQSRSGIALCLSGGGYRAALFECGAVRRLNELGILGKIDAISSVSGGSIFAAHLAGRIRLMKNGQFDDFEMSVAGPFRRFVKNDIRTAPALRWLLPTQWANPGAQAEGLRDKDNELLTNGMTLGELPERPAFHFCATDLAFGVNWVFSRDKVGDYLAGYMDATKSGGLLVAQAVAASSCFPPVFEPMPMHLTEADLPIVGLAPEGDERNACIEALSLTDGGVYDNMGLEPVWKNCATLLVCDGGKPLGFARSEELFTQLSRIVDVMGDQAEAVRKRWLIASYIKKVYAGTYWGVGSGVASYRADRAPGYSEPLAKKLIATIRTDMDRFSDDECAVLENHGYTLADVAIRTHVPELYAPVDLKPLENKFWPDPEHLDAVEPRVREALADSSHVHLLGHN
jgi:NTE family protein